MSKQKTVIIAEKPSLGRQIADSLSGTQVKRGAYIEVGNNTVVWCQGHLFNTESPPPEWRLDALPYIPAERRILPVPDKEGEKYYDNLRKTIQEQIKDATVVVHAGDAGREGQRIIDEVLEYYGYKGRVLRLWLENTTPEHIKGRFGSMQENTAYAGLTNSGIARTWADFYIGINLTRLYTLLAQENGYKGKKSLAIGRVKTAILAVIVDVDIAIENHASKPFWVLDVTFNTAKGPIKARWKPKDQDGIDEDGRIVDINVVHSVINKITGKNGIITELEKKEKTKNPPLLFSLSTLQIDCANSLDLSPADTLKKVQEGYENQFLSYPRTESEYAPLDHWAEAPNIFETIKSNAPDLQNIVSMALPTRQSPAWSDSKVGEHYALIPTPKIGVIGESWKPVYEKIARRYALQFLPPYVYIQTSVKIEVEGEIFTASGIEVVDSGWTKIDPETPEDAEDKESRSIIPPIEKNEGVTVDATDIQENKTTPPKRFTMAGLVDAMKGIRRYVKDPEIRAKLKETNGIGTVATRAGIIDEMFANNYLEKKGKIVISTPKARKLISILPRSIATPDLTALLEKDLECVEKGEISVDHFLEKVAALVQEITDAAKTNKDQIVFESEEDTNTSDAAKYACFKCSAPLRLIRTSKPFWACDACKAMFSDKNGKPEKPQTCPACKLTMGKRKGKNDSFFWACACGFTLSISEGGKTQKTAKCLKPQCKGVLKQISGSKGLFWGCQACKATFSDKDNKPLAKSVNT